MSLNGLDAPKVSEAYESITREVAGWLLLQYITRDEVDVYKTGTGGSSEVREAIDQYADKSPLYGLLVYRRKKVLLKYVPEGTSRLLQARLAVHMQGVLERFPHDAILPLESAAGLTDAALASAVSALKTSNSIRSLNSLKRRRLTEIVEDAGEPPVSTTTASTPPESPASEEFNLLPAERRSEDDNDQDDNASTLTAKAVEGPGKNSLITGFPASQPSTEATSNEIQTDPTTSIGNKHSTYEPSLSPTDPPESAPAKVAPNTFSPTSEAFAYLYKPKVKLAPRPIVEPRRSNNYERPVSTLPTGIQLQSREKLRMISPIATQPVIRSAPLSQQTRSSPTNGIISPSIQSAPSPEIRPVSRGSIMTVPANVRYDEEPILTPEKQRLMKALQKRKQQQKARQLAKEIRPETDPMRNGTGEANNTHDFIKIPSPAPDESIPSRKLDLSSTAEQALPAVTPILTNGVDVSPELVTFEPISEPIVSETDRPKTMIRIAPASVDPQLSPIQNNPDEQDTRKGFVDDALNSPPANNGSSSSRPAGQQFPLWPDTITDDRQAPKSSLRSQQPSAGTAPAVSSLPEEQSRSEDPPIAGEWGHGTDSSDSREADEVPLQGAKPIPNGDATLSAESIDLMLPIEGKIKADPIVESDRPTGFDEPQEVLFSKQSRSQDGIDPASITGGVQPALVPLHKPALFHDATQSILPQDEDDVLPIESNTRALQQTHADHTPQNEDDIGPKVHGAFDLSTPAQTQSSRQTIPGPGHAVDDHKRDTMVHPESSNSALPGTTAILSSSALPSEYLHTSGHDTVGKHEELTEDELEAVSPIETTSIKRSSRPPPINPGRNSVANSKAASLSEEDSLFEELQSATVEEATSVTLAKTPTTPFSPPLPRQVETRRSSGASHRTTRKTSDEDLPPTPALPTAGAESPSSKSQNSHDVSERAYDDSPATDALPPLSRPTTRDVSSSYAASFAEAMSRSRQSSLSPTGPELERPSSRKSTVSSLISQRIKAFEDKQSATNSPHQAPLSAVRAQIVTLRKVSLNNNPPAFGSNPAQSQSGRSTPSPYPSPSPSPHNFAQRWGFGKTTKKENPPREDISKETTSIDTISKLNEGVSDDLPRISVLPERPPSPSENRAKKSFFGSSKPAKKKTNSISSSTSNMKDGRLSAETAIHRGDSPSTANTSDSRDRSRSPSSVESVVIEGEKKDAKKKASLLKRLSGLGSSSRRTIAETMSEPAVEQPTKEEHKEPEVESSWRSSVVLGDLNIQFPDTLLWKRRYVEVDSQGFLILAPPQTDKASKIALRRYHVSEFRRPYVPDPDREELPYSVNLDFLDGSTIQCACDGSLGQQRAYQTLSAARDAFVIS